MPRAQPSIKPLLVVDGHNVLLAGGDVVIAPVSGASDPYHTESDSLELAREALISRLACAYRDSYEVLVVFDGAKNVSEERKTQAIAGISVRFSGRGQSADEVIEGAVTRAVAAGRTCVVATNDAVLRATCAGAGAEIFSAAVVREELDAAQESARDVLKEAPASKMTLAERLDPKQRAKLEKLMGEI